MRDGWGTFAGEMGRPVRLSMSPRGRSWMTASRRSASGGKAGRSIVAMAAERDPVAGREGSSGPAFNAVSRPHALGGHRVLWITRPAVLDRIAAWGAARRARSQATDTDRRLAVGAATAIAEMIQAAQTGSLVPWERTLGMDLTNLGERMGVSLAEATSGLDWLVRTGAAIPESTPRSSVQGRAGQFRILEELWTPAPALSAIAWPEVRQQLRARGSRLAPALAVLRAMADRPEAMRAAAGVSAAAGGGMADAAESGTNADGAWGKTSVAHLVNATLFGRSAVLDALGQLEATGVIARRRFPGSHEGDEVRLTPWAFGQQRPPAIDATAEAKRTIHSICPSTSFSSVAGVLPVVASRSEGFPEPAQGSVQQMVSMTVAGISMRIPAGTTVTIDVDEAGRRIIHVGSDIVIGPLS